jgi:hypothetical protein
MNSLKIAILLLFTVALHYNVNAQQPATILKKNISSRTNLYQELNSAKDTLTLKSESDILRVTFLNHVDDTEIIVDVGAKEIKVPLYHFEVGRYTIPVYVDENIIIVGMTRALDIPIPVEGTVDLEDSILQASLSDEEKESRGIETKTEAPVIVEAKPKKIRKKANKVLKDNIREDRLASLEKLKRERAEKKKNILEDRLKRRKQLLALNTKKSRSNKLNKDPRAKKVRDSSNLRTISQKKYTYNISVASDTTVVKQTREEYRRTHLRPNGKKYDDD